MTISLTGTPEVAGQECVKRERGKALEKTKRPGSDKKIPIFYYIIFCVILVAVAVAITYFSVINSFGSKENFDAAVKYSELEGLITDNYIGEADPQSLFDAAASSMVKSLDDKWSYYMSPEQYAAYKLTSSNEYAGIGASIRINDSGDVEITDVANGTPAASAGLRAGELILSVDGTEVAGMALEDVSDLIRSKLDKDFKLVVDDDGSIFVETDGRTIWTANLATSAHDDGTNYGFFLDVTCRRGFFDASNDDIADTSVMSSGTTENADYAEFFGAGVVSHFEASFFLNHYSSSSFSSSLALTSALRTLDLTSFSTLTS